MRREALTPVILTPDDSRMLMRMMRPEFFGYHLRAR
jgi:hypothetical protein